MQRVLLRFFGYTLAVAAIMVLILVLASRSGGGLSFDRLIPDLGVRTSEFSPVEVLQNFLLLTCTALFGLVALRDRLRRPMAAILAMFMLAFLIRELDFFLDFYVIDNLWQVLCAILVSIALVYGIRQRERFAQGWRRSWPSAGLAMALGGIILLIPFAQLLGHEALWRSVLADDYARVVKVAAEEFMELGAYLLITIGTVEFVYSWSRLPRPRQRRSETRQPGR